MPDITSLANELLCMIFLNAIEDSPPKMAQYCSTEYPELLPFDAYHDHNPPTLRKAPLNPIVCVSKNSLTTPVILSQVCKRWHKVACAFPSLWSRIYVSDPTTKHVSLTRQWLTRAGRRPLSLVLRHSDNPTSPGLEKAAEEILLLFGSHSSSWKHIDFRLTIGGIYFLDAIIFDKYQCPQLKSAALSFLKAEPKHYRNILNSAETEYLNLINAAEAVWRKIHGAGMLESITWFATWTQSDFCNDTPWRSLTKLNIQTPLMVNRILSILHRCKQLEVLLVAILPTGINLMGPNCDFALRVVVCSQLKTLHLYLMDRREGVSLLDHLTAPSLKQLSLSAGIGHPTPIRIYRIPLNMFPPKKVLQAFLSRSASCLEQLRLQYYHHDRPTVHQYLTEIRELGSLITLEVFGDISLETFKHFTHRTSTGAHLIMPNLESLVVTRCKPEITKQRALVVARSRWHASPSGEDHRYPGSLRNIYVTPVQRHGTASGMPSWRTPLLGTRDVC